MTYDNNPYYSPESLGLTILDSLEDGSLSYEFNMFIVWRRTSDGALFYASDSGCSCPSPFEDVSGIDDLTPITGATYGEFETALHEWQRGYGDSNRVDPTEIVNTERTVTNALAGRE